MTGAFWGRTKEIPVRSDIGETMDRATLSLMTKDANRIHLGELVFHLQYKEQINQISQYHFAFEPPAGKRLDFNLAGNECTNFFSLLDQILTPHQPNPKTTPLATVDDCGNANGTINISVANVCQFSDGINLYSYGFQTTGYGTLKFMLISTDADSMFYVFDSILWSNPPNPDH